MPLLRRRGRLRQVGFGDGEGTDARRALDQRGLFSPGQLADALVDVFREFLQVDGTVGVVVGGLMALTLHPTCRALARRTHRPVLVALGLTVASAIVLGGAVGTLVGLLVLRGVSVLSGLPADIGGVTTTITDRTP